MPELIYFDQAATSFPKPPVVVEAVCGSLTDFSASPGRSGHRYALAASRVVFEARENMAELLGVDDSSRIVFTANVTQALNLSLSGYLQSGDHVLISSLEHNSVMRPLTWLAENRGLDVEVVPLARTGLVDPEDFRSRLNSRTRLVVVNHASNVTGAIAPLRELKAAVEPVTLLVDGAQSAGSLDLNGISEMADLFAFTGHKALLGPTGTGGLWVRPGLELEPLIRGGTGSRSEKEVQPEFMPDALEAGTPNTHGLAGLAAGVRLVLDIGTSVVREHELLLLRSFLTGLGHVKGLQVYGPAAADHRVAVVSVNLDGWSTSDLSGTLENDFSILTRPGLHCAPRAHQSLGTWPVGTVRFSFGYFNTLQEIDAVLEALDQLSHRRSKS